MDESTRLRAGAIFAAMGHPGRLALLGLLREREMSVGELTQALGMPQPSVSQHLAALLRAGVLVVTPRGTSRIYRIRGPRIVRMLDLVEEFCRVQGLYGEPEELDEL